ncbi:MAG: hypothetical protein LBN20_04955 [Endomicrobium sp.]|jgi:hypothetical protein|nr:hypothetical protein [Endomicrobium sp.]
MKKIILALSILIAVSAFVFSKSKDDAKQLLEADPNFQFHGYAVVDNVLFVLSWAYTNEENIERKIYKYVNGSLVSQSLKDPDIDFYWKKVIQRNDKNNNRIDIDENRFIEIVKPDIFNSEHKQFSPMDYFLILSEYDKQTLVSKDYVVQMFENYIFFNKDNNKLYFCAINNKKETIGIVEYDIKRKKFADFAVESIKSSDKKIFEDPIKIPKIPYLLYRTETGEFWIKPIK